MVHNLNFYKSRLAPGTHIMAMVKAFSYGSGSYEIASMLQFHKVDYLAVAYTDEGATLRQNGIKLPVMVMSPEPQTFETLEIGRASGRERGCQYVEIVGVGV